ncbi:hypothetical protein jhhlp_008603 [Lomentospora prolificans]|uniref:Urease accessory protein UreD n=1 Tax=Lomentospora prolificans TaxID=41688 RepID=A0A2N3MYI5_9PEZI|nr:hypothetical protein jhhlp_008603 [Lomentospora prolificans]
MPHKHTRKGTDPTDYDLPPTKVARPLAPLSSHKRSEIGSTRPSGGTKRKRGRGGAGNDDIPRAFKRMMAFASGKKIPSGLDDNATAKGKKSRASTKKCDDIGEQKGAEEPAAVPSIRPGESLSDFAARVDAAIPVSGLITKTAKGGKDPLGLKVHRTLKEKKMHKLYDQWRAEERKIQERREEELELAAEREMENGSLFMNSALDLGGSWDVDPQGSKKKKKKRKRGNKSQKAEEDPWEELRRKRGESKPRLRDVAQAPPILTKVSAKLPVQG